MDQPAKTMTLRWPRGLNARRFLERYWQKEPLLVRGAFPGWRDRLPRSRLCALAARDDVESRMISRSRHREGERFRVTHGPQDTSSLARLGRPASTLLVQGVNLHVAHTLPVLDAFGFVPLARRDDLMVSDASVGGGVGPHVDSYDVFLLQARGRRLWRIARTFDDTLVDGAPLRLLAGFVPEDEYLLEPGDFLYLPPGVAHDGLALDACATWSIGFRAPSARELAEGWLAFVEDRFDDERRYADPDLQLQRAPAWISDQLVERSRRMLGPLAYDAHLFEAYLGIWLTEPKPEVCFRVPSRPLSQAAFGRAIALRGLALSLPSLMLYRRQTAFINGERAQLSTAAMRQATRLADTRNLPPLPRIDRDWLQTLYAWYCSGYIVLR